MMWMNNRITSYWMYEQWISNHRISIRIYITMRWQYAKLTINAPPILSKLKHKFNLHCVLTPKASLVMVAEIPILAIFISMEHSNIFGINSFNLATVRNIILFLHRIVCVQMNSFARVMGAEIESDVCIQHILVC